MSPRATRPPAIRYRPARRTDVETLAELGSRTYRVASVEKRREFYTYLLYLHDADAQPATGRPDL